MPRATKVAGPVCRHCELSVKRLTDGELRGQFVHTGTGNVFCSDQLTGLVSRYAEPR